MTAAHRVEANGATIPAIGFGTWQMTGNACAEAVRSALEVGYRHLDTAAMYDNEEAVGAGLRASGLDRNAVFITTKVWADDIARGDLERSAEGSLKRLGLDAVDLLLIHWPNASIPLSDSIGALCNARRKGLTRHIGVSNFSVALLDEAVARASEPLVVNQCEYHPFLDQSAVLAACRRHGLAFTSYSPLGKGEVGREAVIRDIAGRHGKTPGQIVLRWHVQQPGVVAIPKSATPTHIAQNLDVFDFALSEEEMRRMFALARPNGRMVAPAWSPDWD